MKLVTIKAEAADGLVFGSWIVWSWRRDPRGDRIKLAHFPGGPPIEGNRLVEELMDDTSHWAINPSDVIDQNTIRRCWVCRCKIPKTVQAFIGLMKLTK